MSVGTGMRKLSAGGKAILDTKQIPWWHEIKIDGNAMGDVLDYSLNASRKFSISSLTFNLNNDDGQYSPGNSPGWGVGDSVTLREGIYTGASVVESFPRFYGEIRKAIPVVTGGRNVLRVTCLDVISKLTDLETEGKFESAKTAVSEETLTPNALPAPLANMSQVFDVANTDIAQNPIPVLKIKNKGDGSDRVEIKWDGYEINYQTGQVIVGSPLNTDDFDITLDYSYYASGTNVEDILQSIITAVDGYGNTPFTTGANLTETSSGVDLLNSTTDTMVPNFGTETIDAVAYPPGQVWYNCVDQETECLTKKGWKKYDKLNLEDEILTLNTESEKSEWNKINKINKYDYNGELRHIKGRRIDALVTDNHNFPIKFGCYLYYGDKQNGGKVELRQAEKLKTGNYFIKTAKIADNKSKYSNDFVELAGWILTEGSYRKNTSVEGGRIYLYQSEKNKKYCKEIKELVRKLKIDCKEYIDNRKSKTFQWRLKGKVTNKILNLFPEKILTMDFIVSLNNMQRELLFHTMIKADGHIWGNKKGRMTGFYSKYKKMVDVFGALCVMINKPVKISKKKQDSYAVIICESKYYAYLPKTMLKKIKYKGVVWCPTVKNGTFLARRNGVVYFTGNSFDNIQTSLVAGNFTVPGATITIISLRFGRIILNTPISTAATVTCNIAYSFITLQSTGIEVPFIEFNYTNTKNRWDAIQQLKKTVAPNYIIRTKGTNKIWGEYLRQKIVKDYDLKVPMTLNYGESDDVYTRVKLYGKNNNPKNLILEGTDFVPPQDPYEAYAHKVELGYVGGWGEAFDTIQFPDEIKSETVYNNFTTWSFVNMVTESVSGAYKTIPNCVRYIASAPSSGTATSPNFVVAPGTAPYLIAWCYMRWDVIINPPNVTVLFKAEEYDSGNSLLKTTTQGPAIGLGVSSGSVANIWQRLAISIPLRATTAYIKFIFSAVMVSGDAVVRFDSLTARNTTRNVIIQPTSPFEGMLKYRTGVSEVGKIIAGDPEDHPLVFINDVLVDNQAHQIINAQVAVTEHVSVHTDGGKK